MAAGGCADNEITKLLEEFKAGGELTIIVLKATVGGAAALVTLLAAAKASGAGNRFDMLDVCDSNEEVVPIGFNIIYIASFIWPIKALIARMIAAAEGLPPAPKVLPPCGHEHCNRFENCKKEFQEAYAKGLLFTQRRKVQEAVNAAAKKAKKQ